MKNTALIIAVAILGLGATAAVVALAITGVGNPTVYATVASGVATIIASLVAMNSAGDAKVAAVAATVQGATNSDAIASVKDHVNGRMGELLELSGKSALQAGFDLGVEVDPGNARQVAAGQRKIEAAGEKLAAKAVLELATEPSPAQLEEAKLPAEPCPEVPPLKEVT